jgi:hypothetical protein
VPADYGTIPVFTGTPEILREELKKLKVTSEVVALRRGETLSQAESGGAGGVVDAVVTPPRREPGSRSSGHAIVPILGENDSFSLQGSRRSP